MEHEGHSSYSMYDIITPHKSVTTYIFFCLKCKGIYSISIIEHHVVLQRFATTSIFYNHNNINLIIAMIVRV